MSEKIMGVCPWCDKELDVTPYIQLFMHADSSESITITPKYHDDCEKEVKQEMCYDAEH